MNFKEMCIKAYEKLASDDFKGIYLIKDIGDHLVFYGGNPNEVYYGCRTVSVDKTTGACEWYIEDYSKDVIERGISIPVPTEFFYKVE